MLFFLLHELQRDSLNTTPYQISIADSRFRLIWRKGKMRALTLVPADFKKKKKRGIFKTLFQAYANFIYLQELYYGKCRLAVLLKVD